jgi:hypothetical protein
MKQLLITFFAIILCYSLFFDRRPGVPAVEKPNDMYDDVSPGVYASMTDTLNSYTYTYSVIRSMNQWDPFPLAADKTRETPASILIRP